MKSNKISYKDIFCNSGIYILSKEATNDCLSKIAESLLSSADCQNIINESHSPIQYYKNKHTKKNTIIKITGNNNNIYINPKSPKKPNKILEIISFISGIVSIISAIYSLLGLGDDDSSHNHEFNLQLI